MIEVAAIEHCDEVVIDRARLARLSRSMGPEAALRVAERAIEEVAERICAIELAWRAGEFGRMAKTARALVAVAEQIGMTAVAEVAGDVRVALAARDDAALAAIVSRLVRVGDASIGQAARADMPGG